MRRREFVRLLGGAAAWPLATRAQQANKLWHIGMLDTTSPSSNAANIDAFRQSLQQLRYVEGENVVIDYRWGEGRIERFPELADGMVRDGVDVIVTRGTPAALAAKKATATIPIVMAAIGEPVQTEMVASLAHPGGNVTGLSAFVTELTGKRVELMREVVPNVSRLAMLDNMANGSVPTQWEELKNAALRLGIEPLLFDVRRPADVVPAFSAMMAQHVEAIAVGNDSVVIASRAEVTRLAAQHRLPAIYATKEFVEAGGLMSYAAHYGDLYRRAAIYVDKIFKGAKPADLPVEQPTKLQLVINLKAARELGLAIPLTLVSRADEVIE